MGCLNHEAHGGALYRNRRCWSNFWYILTVPVQDIIFVAADGTFVGSVGWWTIIVCRLFRIHTFQQVVQRCLWSCGSVWCLIILQYMMVFHGNIWAETDRVYRHKWMKGREETNRLWQICWCPPNGICQDGNPQNMMPLLARRGERQRKNSSLLLMCSITSCIRMSW